MEDFAKELARLGVELVSTGGTRKLIAGDRRGGARHLRPHRLSRDDGRAGQDAAPQGAWRAAGGARQPRRTRPRWTSTRSAPSIWWWSTSIRSRRRSPRAPRYDETIENIDIGGPAMIRSAAKNHAYVTVVVDPNDYEPVLEAMRAAGRRALRAAPEACGQGLCAHRGLRLGDLQLVRRDARL